MPHLVVSGAKRDEIFERVQLAFDYRYDVMNLNPASLLATLPICVARSALPAVAKSHRMLELPI